MDEGGSVFLCGSARWLAARDDVGRAQRDEIRGFPVTGNRWLVCWPPIASLWQPVAAVLWQMLADAGSWPWLGGSEVLGHGLAGPSGGISLVCDAGSRAPARCSLGDIRRCGQAVWSLLAP